MNRILTPVSLFVLAAGLSAGAFAASKSMDINISNPTQINGTTLKPGKYTVQYKNKGQAAAGQTADVEFKLDGKQVATVTGQVKQLSQVSKRSELTINNEGGVPTIAEIDFAGSTTGITFSSEMAPAGQ
jgi:hypothetical protein